VRSYSTPYIRTQSLPCIDVLSRPAENQFLTSCNRPKAECLKLPAARIISINGSVVGTKAHVLAGAMLSVDGPLFKTAVIPITANSPYVPTLVT